MKNTAIVFDFDKTLTYNDTLFDFYVHTCNKSFTLPIIILLFKSNDII